MCINNIRNIWAWGEKKDSRLFYLFIYFCSEHTLLTYTLFPVGALLSLQSTNVFGLWEEPRRKPMHSLKKGQPLLKCPKYNMQSSTDAYNFPHIL